MDLRKLPALTEGATRIGYLTNCYVTPEFRGHGIGSRLLGHIKQWAADKRMELLLVWPGESAYPFYADNGFARAEDPLVVNLHD